MRVKQLILSAVFASGLLGSVAAVAGPFQNNLIWLGPIPDTVPESVSVFEYNAIPLISTGEEQNKYLYQWWESVVPDGFQACVLGATYKLDAYSTMTVGLTRGCAG